MIRKCTPHVIVLQLPLVLSLVLSGNAEARDAVIGEDLQAALRGGGAVYVNVALESQADPGAVTKATRGLDKAGARKAVQAQLKAFHGLEQSRVLGLLRSLEARGLVQDVRPFWIANIVRVRALPEAVEALAELDEVAGIALDKPRQILSPMTGRAPSTTVTAWGVRKINADHVWYELGYTGEGVLVAMVDTGIDYTHSDLANRIWHNTGEIPSNGVDDDGNGYIDDWCGYDFSRDNPDPMDDYGHGTLTAGVVAGDGTGGTRTGVAPGAMLMPCKALNGGTGYEAYSWEAIEYAVASGADVINLSIGWIQCYHTPARAMWRSVLENAMAAGVVVCAAAGNEGADQGEYWYCPPPYNIRTPGDVPGVITLGAVDTYEDVPAFSGVGPVTWESESPYDDYYYPPGLPKPNMCAPGVRINTTVMGGGYSGNYYTGTSLASPHAAGTAALMLEKNPLAPPYLIKQCMEENTAPLAASPEVSGHGRLDALAAVSALPLDGDTVPPAPITDLLAAPGPGFEEVTLQWTATGDDGTIGSADSYDVRYVDSAAGPIDTEAEWEAATQAAGEPDPYPSGHTHTMTVGGLAPNGGYYFAIKAYDDYLNASDLSNSPHSYTGAVDFFAESQTTDFGSHLSGDLTDLEASDDSYLVLEEMVLEQGPKPKRHDELIHTWTFTVPEGHTQLTLHVEAYHSFTLDYDDFTFSYSTDGSNFTELLTVTKRADDDQAQTGTFPEGVCGTVYVRVTDTNREKRMDHPNTLYVDRLFLRGVRASDSSPPLFAGLEGAVDAGTGGAVSLSWSPASDPEGSLPIRYNVYRATTSGAQDFSNPTYTTFDTDYSATGLTNGVTYYFVVRAQDTCGNEESNTVEMSATPSGGAVCSMFVAQIDLHLRETGLNWKVKGEVTLGTDEGCSAEGALVEGSWYLNDALFGQSSGVADANGVATLLSPPQKASNGDVFKFTVTSVAKDGVVYDPAKNVETEDSIVVNDVTPTPNLMTGVEWLAPRSFGSGDFEFNLRLRDHVPVTAGIYDTSGRLVRRLADGTMGPGPVRLVWDGSDINGRPAPSGVYYYIVKAAATARQGKIVLVR